MLFFDAIALIIYEEAIQKQRKAREANLREKDDQGVIDVEARWVDDPPDSPKLPFDPKTLHSR